MQFCRLHEEVGFIEANEKIGVEKRVVGDIRSAQIQGVRWKSNYQYPVMKMKVVK